MRAARIAAFTLAFTLASAAADAQPTSDPTRVAAAQQRFERGLQRFDADDFSAAVSEFRAALELFSSPNTRLYVGLCLMRLGRLAEASVELERTFHEARDRAVSDPNYVDARDISERELRGLRPRLGRLTVTMPSRVEGATVRAGETTIAPAMLGIELPFDPGDVEVVATAPGHLPFRRTVNVAAGAATQVEVALEAAPVASQAIVTTGTAPPPSAMVQLPTVHTAVSVSTGGGVRTAGYVVAGVGLASIAVFAVSGTLARSTWEDIQRCVRPCATALDDADRGETLQLVANVSLGVGLALAVTGAVMIGLGGPRVVEEPAERRATRLVPWIDPSRGTLGVTRAF